MNSRKMSDGEFSRPRRKTCLEHHEQHTNAETSSLSMDPSMLM
jgi:transcriptional regulator NrdR family protein